jgi:hypothetical protein
MAFTSPFAEGWWPGQPAGGLAGWAWLVACAARAMTLGAADEHVEPWIAVLAAQSTMTGDDLPPMSDCSLIVSG